MIGSQRGSYVAGSSLLQLIARLVRAPLSILEATTDVLTQCPTLVVRSGHSTQSNPRTIAEARCILILHLMASCTARNGAH